MTHYMKEIPFMDVGGFKAGHAQDMEAATGCTVLLFDTCAPAGVDIRGGGPASRETPLLNPVADAKGLHGLLLSGGSAFALDAAGGVMRYLEERNIGFDTGVAKVPLVCQSCVFDLAIGSAHVRPGQDMAYAACENASYDEPAQGTVGAGTGCTVGKYRGMAYATKSGIGTYAVSVGDLKIGAIVAVNALGDVFDIHSGAQIAGLLNDTLTGLYSTEAAMCMDVEQFYRNGAGKNTGAPLKNTNTTIGAVITNGQFDKSAMNKIASMAHNGLARTIRPVHTMADGDSIYALSTGNVPADLNVAGTLAAYVMGRAVNSAVRHAAPLAGIPTAPACRGM